ncbi:MAG: GAF domain-containing protein, partial [Deltaproteobacteria bacterium]|nr:GAF domain-containing protein [Deltaproteobacteria bacterium]
MSGERRSVIQIHHRGDRGVDGILRLIELAGHDGAIEAMLTAMCVEIAAIAGADVASVYVAEDMRLVMRGNCGFPPAAIGRTALGIGEGITGLVAECMRPISAAHAAAETAYKHVPGLGEEKYPVFVGVPLIGGGAALGVLVLQRRARPFDADEVTLATALGAPVTLAIERRRATALRSARLAGSPQVPGAVLGRAALVPTTTALDRDDLADPDDRSDRSDRNRAARGNERLRGDPDGRSDRSDRNRAARGNERLRGDRDGGGERDDDGDDGDDGDDTDGERSDAGTGSTRLDRAFNRLREDQGRAMRRLADADDPATGAALDRFALALCDARLRERLAAAGDTPRALRAVARDYAKTPYRVGTAGASSHEQTAELEELCVLLCEPAALRPGAVWIADRIAPTIAIAAVARGASALVASDAIAPAAIAVARAAGLPAVA